jgi:hypothetical protein
MQGYQIRFLRRGGSRVRIRRVLTDLLMFRVGEGREREIWIGRLIETFLLNLLFFSFVF